MATQQGTGAKAHAWTVTCQKCDGAGLRDEDEAAEGAGLDRAPGPEAYGASSEAFWTSCADCHGSDGCDDGKVVCPACEGGDDNEDCKRCEGDGTIACEDCDGTGGEWDTCGDCHESLEHDDVVFLTDGSIICESCGDKRIGAGKDCPACEGEGSVTMTDVAINGTAYPLVGASCSRCGGRPHNEGEPDSNGRSASFPWFVARARMLDSDGVFYSYLCTSPDGSEGCLIDTSRERAPERQADALIVLDACAGDDDDGLASNMRDLGGAVMP